MGDRGCRWESNLQRVVSNGQFEGWRERDIGERGDFGVVRWGSL